MNKISGKSRSLIAMAAVLLAGCTSADLAAPQDDARSAFFNNLGKLCGASFEGQATDIPPDARAVWEGKHLTAKVTSCTSSEIRVPFAVGEDRSRTWIFTRTADGLTLAHDHRHADGTPDQQTMYGGAASAAGTSSQQYFHADDYTKKLVPAAATNIWQVTLEPDGSGISYVLTRNGNKRIHVRLQRKT
jgi:hypothetical protein